jgi:glycosyltransferase involved in cell wall biosynthesis
MSAAATAADVAAPLVSLVIPFYNCRFVGQAVASALAQSWPRLEVIVVDDGSTRHRGLLAPFEGRVRIVDKPNGGTASALNAGIAVARGRYFTWLSSDDLYAPAKIERQVLLMEAGGYAVSYGAYLHIDPAGRVFGDACGTGRLPHWRLCSVLRRGCPINGCTVMVRMDALARAGRFDERLRFAQDYDMWLRLARHHEFGYVDEPLVFYRVHEEMTTRRQERAIPPEVRRVRRGAQLGMLAAMGRALLRGALPA